MKIVLSALLLITSLYFTVTFSHEQNKVDGMNVLFGTEPEPAMSEERQYLRWRITDAETSEPVSGLEEARVTITVGENEYGPFEARTSPREPGMYQTAHIFTTKVAGEAKFSFKKAGEDDLYSITFPLRVFAREEFEIP